MALRPFFGIFLALSSGMKIKNLLFVTAIFLSSCGSPALIAVPSLSEGVPRIIDIAPANNAVVSPYSAVSVTSTKAVDPDSVNGGSFLVVKQLSAQAPDKIEKDIKNGVLKGIEGDYQISDDGLCITFQPSNELNAGAEYSVVVTRQLFTKDRVNLSQTFVSKFTVESADVAAEEQGPSPDASVDDGTETVEPTIEASPTDVYINEIYYDATDLDTNGDVFIELLGTPLAGLAGYKIALVNGDDGKVYDTIELTASALIGDDGFFVIADAKNGASNATNVLNYDLIDNFDPQNGPDAVRLIDASGEAIDTVCYGDVAYSICSGGAAAPDAPAGNSIERAEDGSFTINPIPTPGV